MEKTALTRFSTMTAAMRRRPGRRSLPAAAAAALLLWGAAARADDDDGDPPHITVRGTASMPVTPDVAVLRLAVRAEEGDAAAALKAEAAALAAVSEAAAAQGVAAADIAPGTVTLEPVPPGSSPNGAQAFRAGATLRVRLHDPGRVGAVLAALASKGATRVEGVDYGLADPSASFASVTGMAVADARRRAEAAAGAAHVKLGAILSIEPPDEPAGGSRIDRGPGAGGRGSVSTTVEVSFAIDR